MVSLARSLPPARYEDDMSDEEQAPVPMEITTTGPPPYGARLGWVPRSTADFGDGGAFPEIHVAQFPMDMGRKNKSGTAQTVALTTDATGKVKYDAILQQNRSHDTRVQSSYEDIVPKPPKTDDLALPDDEQIKKETEETAAALAKIVSGKSAEVKAAQPQQKQEPKYIRYTPSQQGPGFNSGAQQRIIRMVEMPTDPLEPPKFKHKKVPRSAPSPPVPVLHSPPRKLTVKDQQDWKIPPCVSNWKNAKGYTIALDKRQAADGRSQSTVEINDNFAKLAEALLVAQETASHAIKARIQDRQAQERREKEKKEEELRRLARDARMGRVGGGGGAAASGGGGGGGGGGGMAMGGGGGGTGEAADFAASGGYPEELERETKEEREARRHRDEIREDRRRERERERRLEELERTGFKRSKLTRDRDRDVSEKIALGQAQKTGGGELQYDQRLFNQSEGMDSGFGEEDSYNLYDKPLFQGSSANAVYKHKKQDDEQYGQDTVESALKNARFRVDREFAGTDKTGRGEQRDKPVEFEKDKEDEDLFGLEQFLNEAKSGRKGDKHERSGRGSMHASGDSNHRERDSYSSSGRSRVDFERGRR